MIKHDFSMRKTAATRLENAGAVENAIGTCSQALTLGRHCKATGDTRHQLVTGKALTRGQVEG